MAIYIGHASIDENGKIAGGTAGDQTGKEVCKRTWYSKPWDFIAIHPDANVREIIAKTCEAACANDRIGYDQNQRNTLYTQAKAVSFDLSKITTACECDCSSLMNVCCVAAGVGSYGSNGWTTSTMKTQLTHAGFKIITASGYLTSSAYCVRGGIYVKAGSHTVCGLDNGSKYADTLAAAGISSGSTGTSSSGSSTGTSSSGYKGGDKISLSAAKLYKTATTKTASGTKSGVYYIWDGTVTNGRIRITNKASNAGVANQITGWIDVSDIGGTTASSGSSSSSAPTYKVGTVYKTQVDDLNVRTGAGTNYAAKTRSSLTANAKANANAKGQLKKGTSVTCKAVKTVGSDIWMQIPSGWIAAYYSGKKYVS